jgi:hypothetical protein
MKMQITATTDHQHHGQTFDSDDAPIVLGDGVRIFTEYTVPLSDGIRFVSSNYIIDARKV